MGACLRLHAYICVIHDTRMRVGGVEACMIFISYVFDQQPRTWGEELFSWVFGVCHPLPIRGQQWCQWPGAASLLETWTERCVGLRIPVDDTFTLASLTEPVTVRDWGRARPQPPPPPRHRGGQPVAHSR